MTKAICKIINFQIISCLVFLFISCRILSSHTDTQSATKLIILENPKVDFKIQTPSSGQIIQKASNYLPIEFSWILNANRLISFDSINCFVNGELMEKLAITGGSKAIKKLAFNKLEYFKDENRVRAPIAFKTEMINTIILVVNLDGELFYIKHDIHVDNNFYKILSNDKSLISAYPLLIQNGIKNNKIIKINQDFFNFQLTIPKSLLSREFSTKLNKNDIKVFVNNKIAPNYPTIVQNSDSYLIKDSIIILSENIQTVEMIFNKGKNSITLPTFLIKKDRFYKPDLYLLSIGPEVSSLSYTDDDARDFAYLILKQRNLPNRVFQNIFVDTILGHKATKNNIDSALFALQKKSSFFRDTDLVVLYISSHGIEGEISKGKDEYFILPSEFDINDKINLFNKSISNSSINFTLAQLKCRKLKVFDACHSSSNKSLTSSLRDLGSTLYKMSSNIPNSALFASSMKKEYSYEIGENGAFTKIIIEAVQDNFSVTDSNKDRYITLTELYEYVRPRVIELVKNEKNAAQHPELYDNKLGNLILFAKK